MLYLTNNDYIYFSTILYTNTITSFFFFFNDTATTEIYTLSLHDALPISITIGVFRALHPSVGFWIADQLSGDRKSTRLNSSHLVISYAVFCLKKKKNQK